MKKIFLSLLWAVSSLGMAQNVFKGTLMNAEQQGVSGANILLISLPDSTLVKGAISNERGVFELPNPAEGKKLLIRITHLEYEEKMIAAEKSNLGTITLERITNELGEVVVSAKRPILEQKGTRISTNVAQSTLQNLPKTELLINFLPGVSTSYTGGGFEVFGKGNPIFFINNRRVRNLDEINQLSPKDIESIELETQPGAEHDNTVGAVIYIKLKKKQGDGLSGSVENENYVLKKGASVNTWVNLNYRKGKTDWFTTIGNFNNFGRKNADYYQDWQVHTQNNEWRVLSNETNESNAKGLQAKVGVAHEISDGHSVGMSVRGSIEPMVGHRLSTQETSTYKNNLLTAKGINEYDRFNQNKNLSVNAYYESKLTEGLKLQTDVDYIGQRSANTSDIIERNLLTGGVRNVHTHSDAASDWWGLKTTFVQKWGKGTVNYGAEVSDLHRWEDYVDNVLVASEVKNTERRSAGFVSFSYPIKKVNLKVGTRYEYADFGYYDRGQKSEVKSREYRNWLPNVSVAFPWEKTQLTFSYARKIKRPAFYELSDYNSYSSSFLYNRGNPYIVPQLTDEWGALATYGPISASVNYLNIHKGIYSDYQLSSSNGDVIESTLRNYDDFSVLKCVVNAQTQIGKWMPKLTFTYGKPFAGNVFYRSEGRFSVELMNQIVPSENWLILAMFTYASKGSEREAYVYRDMSGMFVGVARMFFNQSLTVFAVVSDPYDGLSPYTRIENSVISLGSVSKYSNMSFKVGLNYNFNSTQSKYKGHSGGETDRL